MGPLHYCPQLYRRQNYLGEGYQYLPVLARANGMEVRESMKSSLGNVDLAWLTGSDWWFSLEGTVALALLGGE